MSRISSIRPLGVALVAVLLCAALPAAASAARPHARASSYPTEDSRPRARAAASRRPSHHRRKPRGPVLHGDALRAYRAYGAMQRYYYIAGSGLYAGEPFSYLWPFSTALASTVSLAHVPAIAHAFRREL